MFFPHVAQGSGGIVSAQVNVANVNVPLQLNVDESYTLSVPTSGGITITANTVYGAYHAMQTLSQLITFDFDTKVSGPGSNAV